MLAIVFLVIMSTLVVAATAVFLWILSEFRATRRENKEENRITREEIRAESRRILEALYFHRHDPNTNEAIFYPPTPTPPATD